MLGWSMESSGIDSHHDDSDDGHDNVHDLAIDVYFFVVEQITFGLITIKSTTH